MPSRFAQTLVAAAIATGGLAAAAPASARTFVSVGIGVPVYPRPYRWGYRYPGYYPPPPYYGPGPVVVGWGHPYWHRPYGWYHPYGWRRPYGWRHRW